MADDPQARIATLEDQLDDQRRKAADADQQAAEARRKADRAAAAARLGRGGTKKKATKAREEAEEAEEEARLARAAVDLLLEEVEQARADQETHQQQARQQRIADLHDQVHAKTEAFAGHLSRCYLLVRELCVLYDQMLAEGLPVPFPNPAGREVAYFARNGPYGVLAMQLRELGFEMELAETDLSRPSLQ